MSPFCLLSLFFLFSPLLLSQTKVANIKEQMSHFQEVDTVIDQQLSRMQQALSSPFTEFADCRKQLAALAARLKDRFLLLSARLADISQQRRHLQDAVSNMSLDLHRLEQQAEKEREAKQTIQEFRDLLAQELTRISVMNKSLVKRVDEYRNDCRKLTVDLQFLNRDMKSLSLQVE